MKKLMLTAILVLTMVLAGAQSVFAAAPLAKSDFTKSYGKNKVNFIKMSSEYDAYYYYTVTTMGNKKEAPKKLFTTKRGITFNSSRKKIVSKYGAAELKKTDLANDVIFQDIRKSEGDNSSYVKLFKKMKWYMEYSYRRNKTDYLLRFYLDRNKKVKVIMYVKDLSFWG